MTDVAALEAEVKEFKLQLETVQSSLQVDPDNTELQSLKAELEELINLTETSIAELKPAPQPSKSTAPAKSRDDYSSKHNYRTPTVDQDDHSHSPYPASSNQPSQQQSFSVNEHVLARWISGDNSFYPARITSITGSSANPVYIVSFKSYSTVESLSARDLRPITNDSRKRKADGSPGISGSSNSNSPAPQQPPRTSVISAAADINPALATQARKEPAKLGELDGARPTKSARKVKANKELEAGKNKWKDFASKTKIGRKDSMFRTGEGVNARVGFTGSGQQMRKDPGRSRHVYQQGEEEPY